MLLVSLIAGSLMVVSCAKEEKPAQEMAKTPQQVEERAVTPAAKPPEKVEEVPVKELETPPQPAKQPPISDIARRPSQKQTRDIMSGNPVKSNIYTDFAGKRVYFCCDESKRRFAVEPENWVKRAQEQGMVLEDAPASP
jgi:YHS domain-containing protein